MLLFLQEDFRNLKEGHYFQCKSVLQTMECTIGAISLSIIVQIKVQYVKKTHVGFMKSFNLKLNAPMVILSSTYASNDQI